ncbi:hypothetical protein BOTBODRAFT_186477 [Botryobasidium botryosum FD-172 SS1]|uniref:Zn(2)-C6 fungal-type domain-containing protein n=1 Tax=Botryobasidium botryosum (strain FD-172 SS1) TaxID=930990 RepID=A0A067MX26_BOTB1|nr:hypothetical protein BOTBODRAFT_186477 [Botryobasidium botryosum FD-172 SS1]
MESQPFDTSLVQRTKKIRRGVACASCRRKKVACDTGKPACGNCIRGGVDSECHYPGSKRTQRLPLWAGKIRDLQEKIAALEAPSAEQESLFWGVWDFTSPYFLSTRWSAIASNSLAPRNRVLDSVDWEWTKGGSPPPNLSNFLLVEALKRSFDFSTDFDIQKIFYPTNSHDNSHLAVVNTLYLLGCYFTPGPLNALEPLFLHRVRRYLARGLQDAKHLLDFIKASAMLAYYYFFRMRLMEGFDLVSTTVAFARGAGLHDLRPKKYRLSGVRYLLEPRDDSELGEYINVWWQVFSLDRGTRTFCQQPIIVPDEEIRTPWPQSHAEYMQGHFCYSDNTVTSLYSYQSNAASARGNSPIALRAKCFALYERAVRIASEATEAEFKATDHAITRFYSSLPQIYDTSHPVHTINLTIVFVRTFALGALLKLHERRALEGDHEAYKTCLEAVAGVTNIIIELKRFKVEDMSRLMGVTWLLAKSFLERNLKRLESAPVPDQIQIERIRLQLGDVKWVFQKVHEQIARHATKQDFSRSLPGK